MDRLDRGGARRRRRRRPPTASRLKGPRKQKSFAYKLLKRGLAKSFAYKLLKRGLANLMSPTSTSGRNGNDKCQRLECDHRITRAPAPRRRRGDDDLELNSGKVEIEPRPSETELSPEESTPSTSRSSLQNPEVGKGENAIYRSAKIKLIKTANYELSGPRAAVRAPRTRLNSGKLTLTNLK
ncbi:hypothetical protein EVAR_95957_1 [Eumeta japonica]|uniref:Uncharacterized protein n=1 Tax=Eumeta variegata TaxID=151549 RepID=A0A4C1V7P7_EUMVA|nr:hypothetical protein EVAR_95957_1 [Eumeta japonica]